MNRIYQIIWNAATGTWVVVSECARSRQKTRAARTGIIFMVLGAVLGMSAAYADPAPKAIPVLNTIAFGSVTITSSASTGRLTVDQISAKLIANWQSFNVGEVARVTFNQPDASSIALNRIAGTAPSEIFGKVLANGKLILVNPAGMTIGINGQISASSVVASTMNISDANFNNNVWLYERGTATGTIDNQGIILSNDGNTSILASSIYNSGTIRAKSGNTVLANGNRLTLDDTSAVLNQVSSIAGFIQSSGTLRADRLLSSKGKVYLIGDRARAASEVQLAGALTAISADIKGRTITVNGNLDSIANTSLNAVNNINIDGAFNMLSNNRMLSLAHGSNAGEGYFLGLNGKVNLSGINTTFRVNGDYYTVIKTLSQLQGVGANAGTLGGLYVIGLDIDASTTAATAFNPIGDSEVSAFTGLLDGLGHRINQLTINKPITDGVGLFGYSNNATLRNVYLENASITGRNNVGGLVGVARSSEGSSSFVNNHVSGNVQGRTSVGGLIGFNPSSFAITRVDGNTISATVSGYSNVGGLIGQTDENDSSIYLTHNTVSGNTQVTNVAAETKMNIGGLVGLLNVGSNSSANVSDSVVTGSVSSPRVSNYLGGAIGQISVSSFSDTSFATLEGVNTSGNVTATSNSNYAGGLVGGINVSDSNQVEIKDSSSTGTVTAGDSVGGLVGFASATGSGFPSHITLDQVYATGSVTGLSNVGGLIGQSTSYGDAARIEIKNDSYAAGQVQGNNRIGGLVGSYAAYYNGEHSITGSHATGAVVGTGSNSTEIGGLVGRSESYFGLTNLTDNSYATGNVSGANNVGGLIGTQVSNVPEMMNVNNSYATGAVTAQSYHAGGLIGSGLGNIQDSHAEGKVTASNQNSYYVGGLVGYVVQANINNSYSSGIVSGGTNGVGGLLGYSYDSTVSNSYSSSKVGSLGSNVGGLVGLNYLTPIQGSYALGNVTASAGSGVGGLVGYNSDSDISNSHAGGIVTGSTDVGGLIGSSQNSVGQTLNLHRNYATGAVKSANGGALGGLIGSSNVYGTVNLTESYASGNAISTAAGANFVGGLLGYTYVAGDALLDISNSYASGQASANAYAGGLIGGIQNQESTVNITNVYAKGLVSASNAPGGLIGYIYDVDGFTNIYNSHWDSTATQQANAIGNATQAGVLSDVTGLTPVQMKQIGSYSGWDISNSLNGSSSIWYINQNVTTPQIRALLQP